MFSCPICKEEFKDLNKKVIHLELCTDKQHKLLNILRKQDFSGKVVDIDRLYNENIEMFDVEMFEKSIENPVEKITEIYKDDNIIQSTCGAKMNCNECYEKWEEYFNPCNLRCKKVFMKKFNIVPKREKVLITDEINIDPNRRTENIKREVPIGMAPELVKYFYEHIETKTNPNWAKESAQVKKLLEKFLPDEIKVTMQYLLARGNTNLSFLNNSIGDAILEYKYFQQINTEGTSAYLVNIYYNAFGIPLMKGTFMKDVNRLNGLMNDGLIYENAKITIEYMIKTKCNIFAYIPSKIVEAVNSAKNRPENNNYD